MGILDNVALFSSLSPEEKQSLEMFCQERKMNNQEILFSEGDDASSMYIVKSGELQAYTYSGVLGNIGKDCFVGEMALFSDPGKKRTASVKSISDDTVIIVILYFSLLELERKHPAIMEKIKTIISKRKEVNEKK